MSGAGDAAGVPDPRPLVFITGASSGIGQALALRYHQGGWRLALVARRSTAIEAWAQRHALPDGDWCAYGADVREPASVARAAAQCLQAQGLPDLVIANAGISVGMDTADPEDLQVLSNTLQTNVVGVAATFAPFLQAMRQRGQGQLVGIASVAGVRGLPGHGAYCASKAAVIAYCESLRGECRGSGVQVITVAPGYVDTPLTRRNRHGMPFILSAAEFADRAARVIARGRSYSVIPWPMAIVARLMRLLPDAVFDRLLAGRARKPRQHEMR